MDKTPVSPEQKTLFQKLIDTHPEIQAKGKNLPYTSYNGNMFTVFSSHAKFGIRLGKAQRTAFIEKYNSELLASYGAIMREYVTVPDDLLERTEELAPYLAMSYEYVKTLPAKATTKKKK